MTGLDTRLEELLGGLDDSQREAVTSPGAPLCILAGAGSGKTRVLTGRIAHRVLTGTADPRHVLALTFSRRAAGELRQRLDRLGIRDQVSAGTFHAVAYATLRQRWADRKVAAPELLERKARLLAPMLPPRSSRTRGAPATPADVAAEIEWAKARLVTPEDYEAAATAASRTPPLPLGVVASLYRRYEDAKRARRLVDFDDLLQLCATAIERDPEFAAAQRWRHRHLFVDEFQDVNPLQYRLLEAWRGGRADLCVVGDPDQAIYAWNGADAGYLRDFARFHHGATVVRLRHNYRSTPEILAAGAALLAQLPDPSPPLRAQRASGPPPTVRAYPDDRAEAQAIARRLREARGPGRSWSSMAVLTRTNAQLAVLEEALKAAQVPYRIRGGAALLDQPEVRGWLQRPAATPLAAWLADLGETLAEAGSPDDEGVALAAERRANLEQLLRLGHEYAALGEQATVGALAQWLAATLQRDDSAARGDAVDLVTFHAAKGLEWPVVVLAGMEHGLVPHAGATGADGRAEETRLAYVAVTRAEEELHCTWAERRTFGERVADRKPSPFLAAIESAGSGAGGGTKAAPETVRRLLAAERGRLRREAASKLAPADAELLAKLKAWRTTEARAADVPAYVVFSDATLEALAVARPRSEAELRRLPGLGPVKVARYGERLLALVAEPT